MPSQPQTWFELMSQVQYLMPSVIGGVLGFFRRFQHDPEEHWAKIAGRFALHLGIAGLNGYLVWGIGPSLGISDQALGPACAIAGYLGSEALDWVEAVLKRRADRL